MTRPLKNLILAFLLCGGVYAQDAPVAPSVRLDDYMEPGAEISGVRVPHYDAEGNLRVQLYIGQARMLGSHKADVSNIRIDVYEDGAVSMTIYAPQCITSVEETETGNILAVESEGDVLIEMDQMSICGRGFRFSSESNRFEILSEAKVLVKESARNVEGLEL